MPEAEFYERQYELAMNVELVRGLPFFFAPTPGLEEFVGFDVAISLQTRGSGRCWACSRREA